MLVSLAQFRATEDKADNLARIVAKVRQAAESGAALVVFPEEAMVRFTSQPGLLYSRSEPIAGPFVEELRELARANRLAVACGVYEPAPGGRAYNTIVVIGDTGDVLGRYRKIHLFDAFGYHESDLVKPGAGDTLVVRLGGINFGVMNCYDLRFPELARRLVDDGADAFIAPAAWTQGLVKEDHWEVLVRARAIENTSYMLACGHVGNGYIGTSMLVDPLGVVRARASEDAEDLVQGEVDPERLASVRDRLPSLMHRRLHGAAQ